MSLNFCNNQFKLRSFNQANFACPSYFVSFSCLAGKSDLNMDYAWLMRKKLVSPLVNPVSFSLCFPVVHHL